MFGRSVPLDVPLKSPSPHSLTGTPSAVIVLPLSTSPVLLPRRGDEDEEDAVAVSGKQNFVFLFFSGAGRVAGSTSER